MTKNERYLCGTAYHKAGHAVVAWSFGLQVGTISVLADDASGGALIEPADHLDLTQQIAVCAADYTAENVFGHHTLNRLAAGAVTVSYSIPNGRGHRPRPGVSK
jgi:hypothetical protein